MQFILNNNITNLTSVVSDAVKLTGEKFIIKWRKLKEHFHIVQPKDINIIRTQLPTRIQVKTILLGHTNKIIITCHAASTSPVINTLIKSNLLKELCKSELCNF
jgi:hypothetical protein